MDEHRTQDDARIGPYSLVHKIGGGRQGEVWLAVDPKTTGTYAIKTLAPHLSSTDKDREVFFREARIAAQLGRHANIVRVHDVGVADDGRLYLVMDFVDGVDLKRFVDKGKACGERLPIPLVVYIMQQLLRALRAAHRHSVGGKPSPVAHADVRPGNVLISSAGEVQLTDFGFARFARATPWIAQRGTLPYLAPDLPLGDVSPLSDLRAAGAVLHWLLSGKPTPPAQTPPASEASAPSVPTTGRTDVPPRLELLRRRLLETRASDRVQTAVEALAALKPLAAGDPQSDLLYKFSDWVRAPSSGLTQFLSDDALTQAKPAAQPPTDSDPDAPKRRTEVREASLHPAYSTAMEAQPVADRAEIPGPADTPKANKTTKSV